MPPNFVCISVVDIAVKENYLENGIVLKECPEKVKLIPGPALPNPLRRVLEWIEDVVKVDKNSRPQSREN